jgi:hypothetical protein
MAEAPAWAKSIPADQRADEDFVVTVQAGRELAALLPAAESLLVGKGLGALKRILAATAMVEPGRAERLKLTAPREPGSYEYVCTYPDHWKTMYGELVVVEDLEAYWRSMVQTCRNQKSKNFQHSSTEAVKAPPQPAPPAQRKAFEGKIRDLP